VTDDKDQPSDVPGSPGSSFRLTWRPKNPEELEIVYGEPMKIAVFCSGRGSNFKAIMEAYFANRLGGAQPVIMLADSKYAEALNVARDYGLYTAIVPRTAYHANRDGFEKRILEVLKPFNVELVVLAGFQRVLTSVFLNEYHQRVINIHPALLPAFPGFNVWTQEVHSGVKLAGATVHFVEDGVDSGPIIIQGSVPVLDSDDAKDLAERILKVEHRILPQAIRWFAQGRLEIDDRRVKVKKISEKGPGELIWPPLDWDND
jgi:phosphoribosylglycinamide formyltransferase-1